MTNNQLTREENVQAVFDLKAGYTLGLADVEILKRVARMALAAMDSEPVAEVLSNRPGNDTSTIDRALPVGTQLYRHAQPAPAVPEDIPDSVYEILCQACGGKAWMYKDALWNACRAAMLHAGNSPAQSDCCPGKSGNSAVIPDGFVMVPKEPTKAMILSAMRDNETGEVAEIYELMLAAAPQEVPDGK
ncbi:hypothetical protein PTQ57_30010 [Klebsiella pasteurii]|uniref:hypothetical protein n=1 Tax=Klebsiella pasteurii TaxID=2587529 RepID=UPI00287F3D4C|nr:hypothetical protein [Klebsiella pasteurii]MDS7909645.1 hypothetical protein [Klebsiella pasteurii]MDV0997991.1 hypothetical protein [Klebsiella pasteurii]